MRDGHEFQKIYTHPKTGRIVVETINDEPSLTQQQFKDETDINNIMRKYEKTGEIDPFIRKGPGRYVDFSNISDYQTMLETVARAQEDFAALPAEIRKRFENDPGKLIAFLDDANNREEAIKLGFIPIQKQQEPTPETILTTKPPSPKNEQTN